MTKTTSPSEPETVKIYLEVMELSPDRTPYKQYNSKFQPLNLEVVIDLPKKFVIQAGDDEEFTPTQITLDGLAWVNNEISLANERIHDKWLKENS